MLENVFIFTKKVRKCGNTSYIITLPKHDCKRLNIDENSEIRLQIIDVFNKPEISAENQNKKVMRLNE